MKAPRYVPTSCSLPDYIPGKSIHVRTLFRSLADMYYVSSGECARHFRQLIQRFPPQVSSRSTAAVWACHVHNEVNKSLKKDIFDCSKIGDFYDCGCAEDDKARASKDTGGKPVPNDKHRQQTDLPPLHLKNEG